MRHTLMILDDESWIVKGLTEMIDWESEGFTLLGGFTNPSEAMGKIRQKEPDLLLLDIKMPKMSGDIIMSMIREEGIPCEFMILSGYSDFTIAKRALQHGAFDYILKPVEKSELLKSLRRVAKILDDRKSNHKERPIDPKNSHEILSALSPGGFDENQYSYYRIIISDKDRYLYGPHLKGISFYGPVTIFGGKLICLLASVHDEIANTNKYLEEWAKENNLSLGVSKPGRNVFKYYNMYRQASCALCSTYLLERTGCFFYISPDIDKVKQWQKKLMEAYRAKDYGRIKHEVAKLTDQWKIQGNPASVSLLIALLTHDIASESDKPGDQSQIEMILFDDISSQYSNITELSDHLLMLLNAETELTEGTRVTMSTPRTIWDIRKYLLEHYSEELNLGLLSSQFYLTPSYLSELFRRYTGETITGYLLKIRMEKAATLLSHSQQSLIEISEGVGYSDYNYFCRLFKRHYGMSPTRYRKDYGYYE